MWLSRVTILIVVAFVTTTLAFNNFILQNKNTIYKWKAVVKAGTDLPQPYASEFVLQGTIYLQSDSNSIIVQMKNLTHQLYNGVLNHDAENQAKNLPLPPELSELENIFKIVYTDDGLVKGVLTSTKEKLFPRNLKKAVATILQLNNSVVSRKYHYPETFVAKEKSIYGHGNVDYSIFPHDDGSLEIHKSHDMSNLNDLYNFQVTNTNTGPCDTKYEHMLMHDSTKKYYIKKENKQGYFVSKIESVGSVVYYPFGAKSDAQFVEVNQEFVLLEITSMSTKEILDTGEWEPDLSYQPLLDDDDRINNITKNQREAKVRRILPEVQNMLKDIPQYLKEDHIYAKEPDTKRGQTINRLQRILMQFSLKDLDELKKSLSGEALNAFYHVLPIIGTKTSVVYIKKLIIDKVVDEVIAVDLLQHIHETLGLFVHPVEELEELANLNDTYSWDIRKVAILSFGSVINKKYAHEKVFHSDIESDILQKPYKKYIEQYLTQMKAAEKYKVKMTYLLALRNMKLPILLEYLVPPFTDKNIFVNRNLRLIGLWAVGPLILSNPDSNLIMETLWPIIVNPQEHTEIRISAYWYFMKSKPTHSRLRNLHFYMLREKDAEFYKFHYDYLKELIQSANICNEELRIQAAQLMKFTPPVIYGVSSVSSVSYRDVDYGFGLEAENYLISCDTSAVYALELNSYHFNRIQNDYVFFLRVNKNKKGEGGFLTNTIFEGLILALLRKPFFNRAAFLEGAVLKRDQVINTYYFDYSNYEQLVLSFFFASDQFFQKNFLHINYEWFHRVLLPTDLGIPVLWEFLMPSVNDHSISLKRDHSLSKTQIHYRYANWEHHSHGVGFYNPVVDVWQGVDRFHAFDAVLPINLELGSVSRKEMSFTWKKQDSEVLNTAGVRSHVKQAVFIYDDYNYNVLNSSSSEAKDFQVVTNGKQFRHDYNLIQYDDLNSGHKWSLSVYDSDKDISSGSLKHKMSLFAQSQTKHYSTPLEYLFLTLHNLLHFTLLTPDPGIYGFMFRVEPTHKYNITSIDFTIHGVDSHQEDNSFYLPEVSESPNITYTINSGHQILKRWTLDGTLEQNKGHTLVSNKFVLTQQPENRTIRFERLKKWSAKKVSSHINIFVDDENVINIESKGERSLEQLDGRHKYDRCQYPVPYFKKNYYTMECVLAHNTLRHYVYDIKTKNIPSEWQDTFNHWWKFLTSYYQTYYTCNDQENRNISDGEIQVEVDFPIQTHVLDVHVGTSEYLHGLSGIPRDYWTWFGIYPDLLAFSVGFYRSYKRGYVDRCLIYPDQYVINEKVKSKIISNATWTPYFGNRNKDSFVYFRTLPNNKLAVKVTDNYQSNHTMEIIPNEDSYSLTLDGKEVSIEEEYNGEWIYYYVFKDDPRKLSVFLFKSCGIHLGYDLEKATIISEENIFSDGVCFEKNTTN